MIERDAKVGYKSRAFGASTMYADLDYDRGVGAGIDKYTELMVPVRWDDENEEWVEI